MMNTKELSRLAYDLRKDTVDMIMKAEVSYRRRYEA